MNIDEAIAQFAAARHVLPREAMRWSVEHWGEAAPRFLEMLERYADASDRSSEAAQALFFAIYLMAEASEVRAFAPLCRLARDHEAIDAVLGDGVISTLKQMMISTYDGDPGTLKDLIENPDVNEYVRCEAFDAFAWLAATGRIDREAAEAWLAGLPEVLQPRDGGDWVWTGWVSAVYLLGMEHLSSVVKELLDEEVIDPSFMSFANFQQEMKRTLDDPQRMAGFAREDIGPLTDAVGALSEWYSFSDRYQEDERLRLERESQPPPLPRSAPVPRVTSKKPVGPKKPVGRNDPCPCGSGKKFKKCCLP